MHPLPRHHFSDGPICWQGDPSVKPTLTEGCYQILKLKLAHSLSLYYLRERQNAFPGTG